MVEILYKNRDLSRKKCRIKENTIIIEKGGGRGKVAWKPSFTKDSILEVKEKPWIYLKLRTITHKKLMVLEGAEKCVDFTDTEADLNGLNRESLKELSDLSVIKRSGDVKVKHELPFVFWLLVGLSGVNLILTIMRMRGYQLG